MIGVGVLEGVGFGVLVGVGLGVLVGVGVGIGVKGGVAVGTEVGNKFRKSLRRSFDTVAHFVTVNSCNMPIDESLIRTPLIVVNSEYS